ncbi:unnamed protein product [Urochloa decumbens]|uniref:KIB1-4 beta-propeller domain-containing protein n=1 Tax=Urochloa decumbens TaxID=240449 RepID=A0ABC9DTN9_9POAL
MDGSPSRCLTRARPAQAADEPAPQEPGPGTLREVATAERPSKKTCHTSSSTSLAASSPIIWEDLLDSLLHEIIAFLSSFHDLLAFSGTCRSWRVAFYSFPSEFSFNIPPLCLHPDTSFVYPHRSTCDIWQLTDLSNPTTSLQLSAPNNPFCSMRYLGCSYGKLIFSKSEHCLLVDAYSGSTVRSPNFKFTGSHEIYIGILVAPINSPRSQLLLWSRSSMFQWQAGTDSWSQHPFDGERILQIVFFQGEMFYIDCRVRLHNLRLTPNLSMQEVDVAWGEDNVAGISFKPWLVVCGDMLLLVNLTKGTFCVFQFDFSVVPAKLVKVEDLRNHALFVSFDKRSPTFSCKSPERWGGKGNHIYVASNSEDSQSWTTAEVGQARPFTCASGHISWLGDRYNREGNIWAPFMFPGSILPFRDQLNQSQKLWVLPSLVYGVGR